ncbi:MAG: hypothetical protein ABI886_05215 [Betaproteobacteria bacterium]
MRRLVAAADAGSTPGTPLLPERALALALAASVACHLALIAGMRSGGAWWPTGDVESSPDVGLPAVLFVDLSAAVDDPGSLRVRPAGTPAGPGPAAASAEPAGTGKRSAATTPASDLKGVVIVSQSDDIALVDSGLRERLAAEFRGPVTEPPRLESELAVVYPRGALTARRQMQVGVLVVVGENGEIESTKKSFDDALFAPLIDAALATARFVPATRAGRPVRSWTVLAFHFEVEGPPKFP